MNGAGRIARHFKKFDRIYRLAEHRSSGVYSKDIPPKRINTARSAYLGCGNVRKVTIRISRRLSHNSRTSHAKWSVWIGSWPQPPTNAPRFSETDPFQ